MGERPSRDGIRRRATRAHVTWVVVVAGAVALILLRVAQVTKLRPGECDGIGFGCSLHGADAAAAAAIVVVPVALLVLAIGHFVIAVIARRRRARNPA